MIVVAGEALIDLVIGVDGSVAGSSGGGPFNVARTIGRLGGDVTFLGSISTDRFGQRLFDQLIADGVDPAATLRTDLPTTLAAAELDEDGAATYRFYVDGTSSPAVDRVPNVAAEPEAFHVGTLGLVLEPMATTLLRHLAQLPRSTLVVLDPNCRPSVVTDREAYVRRIESAFALSQVVKISTDDARYLAPETDPIDIASRLVAGDVRVVLLTSGAGGTHVITPGRETKVPAIAIDLVDSIGAGDAFGGGFVTWWIGNGLGVEHLDDHDVVVAATHAAQQVAAFTCEQMGAEPPRREQLPATWSGSWTPS